MDGDGVPYQFFFYSPWGEELMDQHSQMDVYSSDFRFNGKELDPETGNYYYGARYYDPKVSVWLSVDPLASERSWLTPYNFVQNNPLLRVDPDGNLDICETCPNEPRFDEFRDSPVNYEFTSNGNGGGKIHLANQQKLPEMEVGPGADYSGAKGGGRIVDPGFSGGLAVGGEMVGVLEQSYKDANHTVNYAQRINGKVRGSAVLTRSTQMNAAKMGTSLKVVGRGITGLSIATAGYQFLNSDQSGGDYAKLTGSIIITGTAAIPFVGPIISIGLGAADAGGAFDEVYNYFDQ